MTPQELIEEFRLQVQDEAVPHLWSDDEILRYLIASQDEMVRTFGGFADVTVPLADVGSPVTRLADLVVEDGVPWVALSARILRVRRARLVVTKRDVTPVNLSDLSSVRVADYGWSYGANLDDDETGDVNMMVLGAREGYARWLRVPPADFEDTCRLYIYRLPFPVLDTQDDALEVDSDHHIHLVKGMKSMAYLKEDAETYDKDLAAENQALFRDYCVVAKAQWDRKRHKPRSVKYGGL